VSTILARPLTLPCGFTIPNRLAKAALSEGLATPAGAPSPALHTLFERFGRGGAGLLLTGNVMVTPEAIGEPGNVVGRSDPAAWRRWAELAQAHGAACFAQVNHAGRQVPRTLNAHPVAPSAVPVAIAGAFARPRALEDHEIVTLIGEFAAMAAHVRDTGFAGVQIHGAHGYLVSQFLSPLANVRADRWGGPLDHRMRFALEVYRATRAAVGASFPVTMKLNASDFRHGGFSIEEAVVVARTLAEEGLDLLEVSGGTYENAAMVTSAREVYFLEFARKLRPEVRCPILLTGGLRSPEVMERVVEEGAADMIGLGRPMAVDPEFPGQVLAGRRTPPRVPNATGRLAGVTETAFYQQQLVRLSQGLEPEPDGSRLLAAARGAIRMLGLG
jgi:2,4-dienoyl-CoA reductase-like NADH-dependent reductase (Old Yellow Enzyme family)